MLTFIFVREWANTQLYLIINFYLFNFVFLWLLWFSSW
jgi:hypothetical protein